MDLKKKVEELERRVKELEARPAVIIVMPVAQPVPYIESVPQYPPWTTPYVPYQPWWTNPVTISSGAN